jgi:hypothetical protein
MIPFDIGSSLLATTRPRYKLPVRVLAPANTSLRVFDTSSTLALTLAISIPEEGPVIRIRA